MSIPQLRELLANGDVTGNWFVQRLIDAGFTATDAVNEYNIVRNVAGPSSMIEITPGEATIGEYHAIDRAELMTRRRPRAPTLPTHRQPLSLDNIP